MNYLLTIVSLIPIICFAWGAIIILNKGIRTEAFIVLAGCILLVFTRGIHYAIVYGTSPSEVMMYVLGALSTLGYLLIGGAFFSMVRRLPSSATPA